MIVWISANTRILCKETDGFVYAIGLCIGVIVPEHFDYTVPAWSYKYKDIKLASPILTLNPKGSKNLLSESFVDVLLWVQWTLTQGEFAGCPLSGGW